MKVYNGTPRIIAAQVEGVEYVLEPGESVDVRNAKHATTLVEYGATMDTEAYRAALDVAADSAREENAAVASASASEGKILARQATVDVESGDVTTPPADPGHPDDPSAAEAAKLKGAALEDALTQRGIPSKGTADEKRAAVAEYDEAAASGIFRVGEDGILERDEAGEFVLDDDPNAGYVTDENGELVLDEDGNPVPTTLEHSEAGVGTGNDPEVPNSGDNA